MSRSNPIIIQGGMGVAVSGWQLARAVSRTGQLGVVSGTALDTVLLRRLQLGDPGGHLRRAMNEFPYQEFVEPILEKYFIPGGKPTTVPFKSSPLLSMRPTSMQLELLVVANFVEVYLAKEDHDGLVGINFLEKIQLPTLPSLYGAMLANVDYVLMGAGIPKSIPGVLDQLSEGKVAELPLHLKHGSPNATHTMQFDSARFLPDTPPLLQRPRFLPIVSSSTLATMLTRKSNGRVDGFVVEGPSAGGHNAPPRGGIRLNDRGEPIYGERDFVNVESLRALGLPFWLAGSFGSPRRVSEALLAGASGVQVGTAFAYCEESGLATDIKRRVLRLARQGKLEVFTDPIASPTGFPFKVLGLEDSLSEPKLYESRRRLCDLGYLRQACRGSDGTVAWSCPSEDVATYVSKGGAQEDTFGRKCLCNALLANVGLGQTRRNGSELPLVTSGDEVAETVRILGNENADSYSAKQVVDYLLSSVAIDFAAAV